MSKTMAEVLAEHLAGEMKLVDTGHGLGWVCMCGAPVESTPEHFAAALSAAGFGLVADAKGEALEEAADAADDPSPEDMDTYFIDQADVGRWLRARAAAVRGEG